MSVKFLERPKNQKKNKTKKSNQSKMNIQKRVTKIDYQMIEKLYYILTH